MLPMYDVLFVIHLIKSSNKREEMKKIKRIV